MTRFENELKVYARVDNKFRGSSSYNLRDLSFRTDNHCLIDSTVGTD